MPKVLSPADLALTIGARLQYFSGTPQWKQFQSPEDASYTLYRSPRGSSRTRSPRSIDRVSER